MRLKKRAILILLFLFITVAAVYFMPRTLQSTLSMENTEANGTVYCTFSDISLGRNTNWVGSASELLEHELLGPLFCEVSISGPVLPKNSATNSDFFNLFFSFPQQNGAYRNITVELIISRESRGDTSAPSSVFINIDNKGYFVTAGGDAIDRFCKNI